MQNTNVLESSSKKCIEFHWGRHMEVIKRHAKELIDVNAFFIYISSKMQKY